jgi:hypothetical protein
MSLGLVLAKNYPSEEVFETRNFSMSRAVNDLVENSNRRLGQNSPLLLRKRFGKPASFSLWSCVHSAGRLATLDGIRAASIVQHTPSQLGMTFVLERL